MQKKSLSFIFFLTLNLFFSQSKEGFHTPDSLRKKNFEQLINHYNRVLRIDNEKAELYANSILSKAKIEKNNDMIYDGYYKLAHAKGLNSENGHPYADSLIKITQKANTKEYPAKAYIIKGILLNNEFKYREALNQYIKAQSLSRNKNLDQFYHIKKLVGILKTATDEDEEALPLFLEYYQYEKKKMQTHNKDIKSYIGSIFSVSNSYNKNKNYQESKRYNKLGLSECKKYNDYTQYAYFIMSEGIAEYYLKNYTIAYIHLAGIERDLLKNKNYTNLSILYYYLGKISDELNKKNEAIHYFLKSDSLSFTSNEFVPILRDQYKILIEYYKKNGDTEKQLKFINKLFYADSVINNSKQYLSKEIYKKYDTPILLEDKEKIISDLSNRNLILYGVLGTVLLGTFCLIYIHKKRIKEYQRQADLLIKKSRSSAPASIPLTKSEKLQVSPEEKSKGLLSDDKLLDLKTKLEQFEKAKKFLRKNITIDSLAKDLGTNRYYLSKSVNELKGKNFSQYLNELRINYIVQELKNDEKLIKHTILSIANDIGYNTSESFANAFKKITGTLPSYYIKSLQEQRKK
ncbi:AraC family transcriptional regulator [Chryseobacterium fluminis]|uniref:helix-turn-helix domain-containing protein n=1 Tax=Chryseobacterium fluminis TaxID=2983606 RepID=UPI002257D939|nr:AraC family transcriptional regulator [Chryseobacterium sp. MMS21-Ot14]UZT98909.1 AraC family transcriptional regulator [Chryseobacterium sp. MMS21-Ot14]